MTKQSKRFRALASQRNDDVVPLATAVEKLKKFGNTKFDQTVEIHMRLGVDPKQSDTVYVCAAGHLWNSNEQRGVFKTSDGGKTWKKILYVDADTGCSDLQLDPEMPSVVYAGMWQFRRQPDFFNSGGAGSALYKSTDGGEHWQKLTNGIPAGHLGRIAVAVAPSRPSVVYALIESKKTALYRSDDLGEHWRDRAPSSSTR